MMLAFVGIDLEKTIPTQTLTQPLGKSYGTQHRWSL